MLTSIKIQNFRSLRNVELATFAPLTVLLGENDAGKTSFLRAVSLVLDPDAAMRKDDCSRDAEGATMVAATFLAEDGESLKLRRQWANGRDSGLEIQRQEPEFSLREFTAKKVAEQADVLRALGLIPVNGTKERQQERYSQALQANELPTVERYRAISDSERTKLPRVEHFASLDYADASGQYRILLEALVGQFVKDFFSQPAQAPVFTQLHEHVAESLRAEVPQIEKHLESHLGREVRLDSKFDISNILGTPKVPSSLLFDLGSGEESLSQRGAGTNKRAWLALEEYRSRRVNSTSYIRLYDEPDANLHYTAQRQLFRLLSDTARATPPTQVIIATHSVTLIDSVEPNSLLMLETQQGETQARRISGDTDVLSAFAEVGRALGVTNLALLYERAFILVEGPTEARALPHLYRTKFGRSLKDDGIVLVDLETCGAWLSVVKVIAANRPSIVRILLDQDCTSANSTAKLTPDRLAEAGLDSSQIIYIGTKEFEDAFSDSCWARSLDAAFKRAGATQWSPGEIAQLRSSDKFSDTLKAHVRTQADPGCRSLISKPTLGEAIGQGATLTEIPAAIAALFLQVRAIAGLT